MRDSPLDEHTLFLEDFTSSEHGASFLRTLAMMNHSSVEAMRLLIDRHAEFAFWMERPLDRARWEATDDIVVYGSLSPVPGTVASSHRGFRVTGDSVEVMLSTFSIFPYVALVPRAGLRAVAVPVQPKRAGMTISTRDEEYARAKVHGPNRLVACDVDCGSPATEDGGTLLPYGMDGDYCFGRTTPLASSDDRDSDGIRDSCEAALAQAFRPMLARNNHDHAPETEPYWSAARVSASSQQIKIFYALSYFRDPGDPQFVMQAHDGDSEFIIVTIHNTNNYRGSVWALDDETLSAHWGAGGGVEHTATYGYLSVEFPDDYRGRPRVWVSWNKHANYRSKGVCDWQWNDVCDTGITGTAYEDVVVVPEANLGNSFNSNPESISNRLVDCTASRSPNYWGNVYNECFWSNESYFAGWKGDQGQAKAGPYRLMLSFYAF